MAVNFIFCSKRMKTIQVKESLILFEVIPLMNAGSFFYVSLLFLHLKSLRELFVFHNLS